jgi:dTDP-4-amino-4,6-dideoxygalactose transaminase
MFDNTDADFKNNNDFIDLFEKRLAEYTGAPYAIAVDRCTNAILLALEYTKNKDQALTIPCNTYLSVPMTLMNYGYNVEFSEDDWVACYQIGDTNIYDYAVGFIMNMYEPGQVQCLSFQQKKSLAIGKGGAILTDDEDFANWARRARHDGRNSRYTVQREMQANADDIIMGYHMNMSPDEAAKGLLLLNQAPINIKIGDYSDYPDISTLNCFKK